MDPSSTRDKIIMAAADLFADKGYTETSIKEIASLAGIRSSTIYFHFTSKVEILNHLLDLYMDQNERNIPSLADIDRIIETSDVETVFNSMFYSFDTGYFDLYAKTLKIILQEQYRNEQVGQFVREHLLIGVENYITDVLQKLVDAKKIAPINCRAYAQIINSLSIKTSVEVAHYGYEEYSRVRRISRTQLLALIFRHIQREQEVLDLQNRYAQEQESRETPPA